MLPVCVVEAMVGDPSPSVDQLRERQCQLRQVVDAFEAAAPGSADSTRLFREVNSLVHQVVTAQRAIPLHQHQAQHDRYHVPVRVLGGVVALAAAAAIVAAVAQWISGWLALLALALLVVGARSVLVGAGERDRRRAGDTPGGRLFGVIVGLIAAVSVFLVAFVTSWALAFAIVGTVLAVSELFWPTVHTAAAATTQTATQRQATP
jgi:hypothetical protein